MTSSDIFWKKCSACKKSIDFGSIYYVCNVSTCNGQRTGYVFCSVRCFDSHIPGARHKNAGAIEKTAPKTSGSPSSVGQAQKFFVRSSVPESTIGESTSSDDVLVIASRLKSYIQDRSGYNTSASVMNALSNHLRILCDRAIDEARADGRKTVMDRDFSFLKKL